MGSTSTKSTTKQVLSPEQRQLLNLALPAVKEIAANPPQQFPGSAIAPFTQVQQQAQSEAVGTAENFLKPFASSTVAKNEALQGSTIPTGVGGLGNLVAGLGPAGSTRDFFLSGGAIDPNANPFLAQSADAAIRPIVDNLLQRELPAIRRGAGAAGQVGSSRQGIAEGLAINDANRRAGDITSRIFSDAFSRGLGTTAGVLESTLGQGGSAAQSLLGTGKESLFNAPQLGSLALTPSTVLDAVGNIQQQQQQAVLSETAQKYITEQLIPFLISKDVANLAFGVPNASTVSTGSSGMNPLQALLGGSMIAANLKPLLFA